MILRFSSAFGFSILNVIGIQSFQQQVMQIEIITFQLVGN